MNSQKLLELCQSINVFTYNNYSVEITKNKYIVKNSLGEIVLDSQKHCHSFYELENLLLGENE